MLENLVRVIAFGELRHRVMDVLIGLVLEFKRYDGQAIEEGDEIVLLSQTSLIGASFTPPPPFPPAGHWRVV